MGSRMYRSSARTRMFSICQSTAVGFPARSSCLRTMKRLWWSQQSSHTRLRKRSRSPSVAVGLTASSSQCGRSSHHAEISMMSSSGAASLTRVSMQSWAWMRESLLGSSSRQRKQRPATSVAVAFVMVMGCLASFGVGDCVTKPAGDWSAGGLLCIVLIVTSRWSASSPVARCGRGRSVRRRGRLLRPRRRSWPPPPWHRSAGLQAGWCRRRGPWRVRQFRPWRSTRSA